jgi:hypothetical protein
VASLYEPVRPVDSTGLTGLRRTLLVKVFCDLRVQALSFVDQICVNILFGDSTGEETNNIGIHGR